ncbi:hypothetical protein NXW20_22815 [Bacteroides faecis]|nr:hypothetical protein [Bacteroides faecis]MCS2198248.1 hypothetical protein [Bacteroides faecis]
MPKDIKTLGNNKARACESLGFVHKKGCASVLTQPHLAVSTKLKSKSSYIQYKNKEYLNNKSNKNVNR